MATLSPAFKEALEPLLTALADDDLIIGHRHSEWTGWAPHIEEDIAFSSIAQDEIGHANLYYTLLSDVVGKTPDELALAREPSEYRNALICERPNKDWAFTLARHFLYDLAERIRLESLSSSSYRPLADVAEKLLREERYHELHADAWFRRLSSGPLEGRHELSLALSDALMDSLGIFETLDAEKVALENSILPEANESLLQRFLSDAAERLERLGLPFHLISEDSEGVFVPTSTGEMLERTEEEAPKPSIKRSNGSWQISGEFEGMGGRRGKHSPDFDELWDDLTKTYREEPSATW